MISVWWYGNGWWWWWIAFVLIFFLIPLGYGWGYRGWGPWYRRRGPGTSPPGEVPPSPAPSDMRRGPVGDETGWGWGAAFLWFILIIAIIWLIAAWGWGGRW
jgi:hypothetical protein